jgi:serine/threonine-protein kinase
VKVRDGIAVGQPGAAAPVTLSLSTSIPNGVHPASASGSAAATTAFPPPRPVRWHRWALAALACVLGTGAGVALFVARHPRPEPTPTPAPTPPPPGLADVRSPDKLVTTRERELLTLLASRQTSPDRFLKGSLELGLLYVHGHRLNEAKDHFERLEKEPFPAPTKKPDKIDPDLLAGRYASMAGRLGQAVGLAHRDTADAAKQSNELVMKVVAEPFPRLSKFDKLDKSDRGYPAVAEFLLRHPNLGESVAESLNRNAATLGKSPPLTPNSLEQLRNPPKGGKKD